MKTSKISIENFMKFCNKNFALEMRLQTAQDNRKYFTIPLSKILLFTLMRSLFLTPSINQLYQFAFSKRARLLFKTKRRLVVSASTLRRTLCKVDNNFLHKIINTTFNYANKLGYTRGLNRLKIGVIDGSYFGGVWGVQILLAGTFDIIAAFKSFSKKGNEYKSALELVDEFTWGCGKKPLDVLVADGLYLKGEYFKKCLKNGIKPLVKYTPEKDKRLPLVIRDAEEILNSKMFKDDIKSANGIDISRNEKYEIVGCEGISMTGLDEQVAVIRVKEKKCKGKRKGQENIFYIVSTMKLNEIRLEDIREIAKGRWHIENNTFKQMNKLFSSKHCFFRNKDGQEFITLTNLLMRNLFCLYVGMETDLYEQTNEEKVGWYHTGKLIARGRGYKVTWIGILHMINESIVALEEVKISETDS